MKRATLKDIAHLLKVSTSTVSRALNNHPDISDELIALVQAAAKELHYRPNKIASNLRNNRSTLIGLIIPEITMFFFPSVIRGIEEVVRHRGFQLLVLQSNDSLEREKMNVQICLDQQVDGLLISLSRESQDTDHLKEAESMGIPIVLFDKSAPDRSFEEVIIDDEAAVYAALDELIDSGCKTIGGLFGNPGMLISQNRMRSFARKMQEAELTFNDNHLFYASNLEEAKNAALEMMQSLQPDGIFAMSDETIAGVMSAANECHFSIPESCSLVGISDGLLPRILQPQISHIHHNGFEVGRLSAECLIERIHSPQLILPVKQHIVPVELVRLQSIKSRKKSARPVH